MSIIGIEIAENGKGKNRNKSVVLNRKSEKFYDLCHKL